MYSPSMTYSIPFKIHLYYNTPGNVANHSSILLTGIPSLNNPSLIYSPSTTDSLMEYLRTTLCLSLGSIADWSHFRLINIHVNTRILPIHVVNLQCLVQILLSGLMTCFSYSWGLCIAIPMSMISTLLTKYLQLCYQISTESLRCLWHTVYDIYIVYWISTFATKYLLNLYDVYVSTLSTIYLQLFYQISTESLQHLWHLWHLWSVHESLWHLQYLPAFPGFADVSLQHHHHHVSILLMMDQEHPQPPIATT